MTYIFFWIWQIAALVSCFVAGIALVYFFCKYQVTRNHPGPVLLSIGLTTCISNIARVALNTWPTACLLKPDTDGYDSTDRPATLSDIAVSEVYGQNDRLSEYEPFFFWCTLFFYTAGTMWYLMLALDLIFSLSNPFLPFSVDSLKHHVVAWPAAALWCIIFRFAFTSIELSEAHHILLLYYLPSYIIVLYITQALIRAWKKSRRLESHAHQTTRRMAKLILPYLIIFATDTAIGFLLYVLQLILKGAETIGNTIHQLALVLETMGIFILFCRDAGVFRALRSSNADNQYQHEVTGMGTLAASEDGDDRLDVSNQLRMDIMKYTSMGIIQSTKQAIDVEANDQTEIVFDDYSVVESMSIVIHGEMDSTVLSFRDSAPKVFHDLRALSGITPEDYLDSFKLDNILSEHGSEGKSGNIFYFTANKQFMVKSVPKEEFDTLRAILPMYHRYLTSNPQTLLCRYYGCHSISLPVGKRRMYFVVMQNLFHENPVHQRFDLKGNCDRRQAVHSNQVERYIQLARQHKTIKKLMMDIDFRKFSNGVALSEANAQNLQGQLCDDIVFLASRGIIDYSILLGVRHNGSAEDTETQTQGLYSYRRDNIYYVGIVDMLQRYNWRWTAQRWFLGSLLCKDKHDVSAVPPDEYGGRLSNFVRTRMFDIQTSRSSRQRRDDEGKASSIHSSATTNPSPYSQVNNEPKRSDLLSVEEENALANLAGRRLSPYYLTNGDDDIRPSECLRELGLSPPSPSHNSSNFRPSSPSVAMYSSVSESPVSVVSSMDKKHKPSFFV